MKPISKAAKPILGKQLFYVKYFNIQNQNFTGCYEFIRGWVKNVDDSAISYAIVKAKFVSFKQFICGGKNLFMLAHHFR